MRWRRKHSDEQAAAQPQPDTLGIKCLLYTLMASRPAHADCSYDFMRTVAEQSYSLPSGRIWWHMPKHPDDPPEWEPGFVCLDPGEFTTQYPSGEQDVVLEAPHLVGSHRLSTILQQAIDAMPSDLLQHNAEMRVLADCAKAVLSDMKSNSYPVALAQFREEERKLRLGQAVSAQQTVDSLYAMFLSDFRIPGALFSPAMALLQIEMACNLWAVADASAMPGAVLRAFLSNSHASAEERNIIKAASNVGNFHYEDGEKHLKRALGALTLEYFYRELFLASHHYLTACTIAISLDKQARSQALKYTPLIAEEGFACVSTGLCTGAYDISQGRRVEDDLASLLANGDEAGARQRLRKSTLPTNPIYPKHYARVAMARAMIQAGGPMLAQGISELHQLESETTSADITEDVGEALDRIHMGLIVGYRESGDKVKSEQYALQVAARFVMRRALGS